jgi:hypothetical protein
VSGDNQVRHIHGLDFVECKNGLAEYRCRQCAEVYFQIEECMGQ